MKKLPIAGPTYDYKLENIRNSIIEEELALTHRKLENIELGDGDVIFTDDSGNQKTVKTLQTTIDDPTTGLSANATAISGLETRVTTAEGNITSQAADITTLQTDLTSAEGDIAANSSAVTTLTSSVSTLDGEVSSLSSSVTSLSTTVGTNTTNITTNASSINGIEGKYAVKINNNGHVSGFGLISTANNATPTSTFTVTADAFKIVDTSGAATPAAPFEVYTSSRTVDGVTVPAGVYMENANITSAQIKTLDADVITAGTINADRLSVDGVTIDSSGGNLIVKNGGVDTTQIASEAVIGRAFSQLSGATGLYTSSNGRIVSAVNSFVKELGSSDSYLLLTFSMATSRAPSAFRFYYSTSTTYTASLTTNVTSVSGTASTYEYGSRELGDGSNTAGNAVTFQYRVPSLGAGTYNFAVWTRGYGGSSTQTREHRLLVQEFKR